MDRIAEFAELEAFLDAPIRKYSTGMVARLAFAAATDVDPDVLLVDEALAVGDERFRAKCHARMAGFRERGKTFLLVSHSLDEVRETCTARSGSRRAASSATAPPAKSATRTTRGRTPPPADSSA